MSSRDAATGATLRAASIAVALVCLALGVVGAMEIRHMSVTHGAPQSWALVLTSSMPRWILLAATLPVALRLGTHPRVRSAGGISLLLHGSLFLGISAGQGVLGAWSMGVTSPAAHFFPWHARVARGWASGLPTTVAMYGAVLAVAWAINEARERERRSVRASQLEGQLQAARLAALRARFQPHFLYNTLNAVAALVTDGRPVQAVAAIEQLSELLHASLRDDHAAVVPVEEEVALAERYLELQAMRFGSRLAHRVEVAPEASGWPVPVLLLQPLVENAVVHGLEAGERRLHVLVRATAVKEGIELVVENSGREGAASGREGGTGVGLATTRARLATAYGDAATLRLSPRRGGGMVVRVLIPRSGPEATRPVEEPAVLQEAP